MTADLTVPLDAEHEDAARRLRIIRESFADARRRAALWQPTTWPPRDGEGAT